MNINTMSKAIVKYCAAKDDCKGCRISSYCDMVHGAFKTDETICREAYNTLYTNNINDPVNHPPHYTQGKIEVADFIADQKLNFDRGNAIKYICRAGAKEKNKEIQDLEKAIWYIVHEIKTLKGGIK